MDQDIAGIIEASSVPVVRRTVAPGGFLVVQDEPLESIFFVVSGLVKLFRSEADGKEVLIGLMGGNELLGEVEYYLGDPLFCHIQAVYRTVLLEIDYPGFARLMEENRHFRDFLLRSLSARLRSLSFRTSDAFTRSTDDLLLTLIRENGRRGVVFTRKMYADYIGVSERSVNRAVRRLEEKGAVVRNRTRLCVPDCE